MIPVEEVRVYIERDGNATVAEWLLDRLHVDGLPNEGTERGPRGPVKQNSRPRFLFPAKRKGAEARRSR